MTARDKIGLLLFSNEPTRGGAEEHMLTLLRKFDRRRFRLHLVCPPELIEALGADLPDDVEALPLSFSSPAKGGAALRFARLLRERRLDVVHAHMFRASLAALPVARLSGVRATVETAHIREHWRQGWIKGSYLADRIAGRFVTQYIAVSNAIGNYLRDEKRLPEHKISVVPNGCDTVKFHPGHQAPAELRRDLGLADDDRILVISARLEPQKGHRILLEALPRVVSRFPDVRVLCVGQGQLRSELEQQSRQLGLENTVRFVGYQSNVRDWLALSEFTILPSFYEGMPLTAIESLASGRTIVASAVDGTGEVVVHGKTGLTVPPGDAARLAEAMNQLLANREYRGELAGAGRKWVVEHFSQENQVRQTEGVYARALRLEKSEVGTEVGLHHQYQTRGSQGGN